MPEALLLLATVFAVLWADKQSFFRPLFHYLPSPFWCYFLPMLLATAGVLPEHSPVYTFLTTYVLAACLLLLLLSINLPSIMKLGPTALGAMAVGAVGIAVGGVSAYAIFARWLPPETWKGVGALSASWIGGSANMLAVKEGLQTPDSVFAPMVIVDTVITYSWMGILIACAGFQERWDRWVGADRSTLDEVDKRLQHLATTDAEKKISPSLVHAFWLIPAAGVVGYLCLRIGALLPHWGEALNSAGWAFLLATGLGILLSLTPAAQLERYGASRWGFLCLYFLLAALGAKARLQYILQAPLLLVMAYVWVFIHAAILLIYGRIFRVPLFFLATSSQANIGGTASTPIVSGIYQPSLAGLGLLLAIAGNVIGTYAGLLIAHACHAVYP